MAAVLTPQEKRIKENGGKIVFGIKDGKKRIQNIFDSFSEKTSYVDVQRAKLFTESFKISCK